MVGTFRVAKGALLAVQVACAGGPSVTVPSLFTIGPCPAGKPAGRADGVATWITKMTSGRLVVDVRASPRVTWSLYATQPENPAAARRLNDSSATCGPGLCGHSFYPTPGGPQQV